MFAHSFPQNLHWFFCKGRCLIFFDRHCGHWFCSESSCDWLFSVIVAVLHSRDSPGNQGRLCLQATMYHKYSELCRVRVLLRVLDRPYRRLQLFHRQETLDQYGHRSGHNPHRLVLCPFPCPISVLCGICPRSVVVGLCWSFLVRIYNLDVIHWSCFTPCSFFEFLC